MRKNASQLLEIPNTFRQTALAMPDKVRQAVALMDDPEELNEMLAQTDAITAYTRHMQHSTEINNALQVARLEIQAGLGRVLPGKTRKETGRGKKNSDSGMSEFISARTAKEYRKVHRNAERLEEYGQKIAEHNASLPDASPDAVEISTAGFLRFAGSDGKIESVLTGNTEWYTPEADINRCRKVMGGIDLDPASNDYAQEMVKAGKFYTEGDNGLEQPWTGRVFLNPPYKMPLVQQFAAKLCEEYEAGAVSQAVLLTDSATDTHWWQGAAKAASLVCFTEGRIKFYNPSGVGGSPTRGQTFLYFGGRVDRFYAEFAEVGLVVRIGDMEGLE